MNFKKRERNEKDAETGPDDNLKRYKMVRLVVVLFTECSHDVDKVLARILHCGSERLSRC